MNHAARLVLIGLFCAVGCATSSTAVHRAGASGDSKLRPCDPAAFPEGLLCGTLEVPENRDDPGSSTIALSVVVVPALEASDSPPLFDLEGGPGDSAVDLAAMYARELPQYRRDRDVVLVDPRGVGRSGRLYCPELDDPEATLQPRFSLAAVERCRNRLAEEHDLTRYGTTDTVRDLDAVRAWLGYDRVHVLGFSYGTLVAQEWARLYPESIATMTLWGPVPPTFQRPRFYGRDGDRALRRLFDLCARRPACAARYPRLWEDVQQVLTRLESAPVELDWTIGEETYTWHLDRAAFGESLWPSLFNPSRARGIPRAVHAAARGDFAPFAELVRNEDGSVTGFDSTEALYLSVTCAEETLTYSSSDGGRYVLGLGRERRQREACRRWPARRTRQGFNDPLVSDIPTLIVVGDLDPVTPPRWAAMTVNHLSHGRVLVVPEMAHSSIGMENADCIDDVIVQFLATASPRTLDTRCVAEMHFPEFR